MTDIADRADRQTLVSSLERSTLLTRLRAGSEYVLIPVAAVIAAFALFSLFLIAIGKSPATFVELVWAGGFGSSFSWGNTLQRASPLILTALTVAIPARIGLTIIGGEGALVLGGFVAAALAVPFVGSGIPALLVDPLMIVAPWPPAASGSALRVFCATRGASTRPSRRCCCPTSPSPS